MKKQIFRKIFLFSFATILCVACSKNDDVTPQDSSQDDQEQEQDPKGKQDNPGENPPKEPTEVKIENGAIMAAFSVSSTQKVYFSQGNLQYLASTATWRFAEKQYDIIGSDNSKISETNTNYIDLFAWGTSGWSGGCSEYQPYSTSYTASDFYLDGSSSNNMEGTYANADWGVYNAISNGGNNAGFWRTLSSNEWNYVVKERKNSSDLYSVASVNGVNGLILLPDNWATPSNITFTPKASSWQTNTYSVEEWSKMEKLGAVFLPAAGYRSGSSVSDVKAYGGYWSTTGSSSNAYCLWFNSAMVSKTGKSRDNGLAVRLVQNIN